MADSYMPTRESLLVDWMTQFRNGISANPSLYGLSEADSLAIWNAIQEFFDARALTVETATRNKGTITLKDDAKLAAKQICRHFAIQIKYDSGVSDSNKVFIGVRPVNPNRDPIHVPQTSPKLSVIGSSPGSLTLHYADPITSEKKRPFGAANIQLFVAVADQIVTNPNEAKFVGAFSKNPIGLLFQPEDNNKQATVYGRWASAKGEVGPWSLGVSYAIAA